MSAQLTRLATATAAVDIGFVAVFFVVIARVDDFAVVDKQSAVGAIARGIGVFEFRDVVVFGEFGIWIAIGRAIRRESLFRRFIVDFRSFFARGIRNREFVCGGRSSEEIAIGFGVVTRHDAIGGFESAIFSQHDDGAFGGHDTSQFVRLSIGFIGAHDVKREAIEALIFVEFVDDFDEIALCAARL